MADLNDIFGDGTSGSGGGSSPGSITITTGAKATITKWLNPSGRTIYAEWSFTLGHVKHYEYKWSYKGKDGNTYVGEQSTTTKKNASYTAPSNATAVYFTVKPVSTEDRKVGNYKSVWWYAVWSTKRTYYMSKTEPDKPPTPTVELDEKLKLTMYVNNLSVAGDGTTAYRVQFQVVRDLKTMFSNQYVNIKYNQAKTSITVLAGHDYRVRCRILQSKGTDSEWSEWSDSTSSVPGNVVKITELKAFAKDSVLVNWEDAKKADEYEVQWTYRKGFFDSNPDEVHSQTVTAKGVSHAEVTGLETGKTWFFRVRAKNSAGASAWSEIASITLGEKPTAPTTWSSTTVSMVGDTVWLYWVHNSADGSKERSAHIDWKLGENGTWHTITINKKDDDDTSVQKYEFNTSLITSIAPEGIVYWRVQTLGISNDWGDYSAERIIEVFAPITLNFSVGDQKGNAIDEITSFPIRVSGIPAGSSVSGVTLQTPVGYNLDIIANESYESPDYMGNIRLVSEGESVFSKYYDISDNLDILLYPDDVDLESGVSYTFRCVVGMDSGLTDIQQITLPVSWVDVEYLVNASINYNPETYTCMIHPFATSITDGSLVSNVKLAVYRRTFDGRFVKIATDIENSQNYYVTDPHPTLDYARYRIVCVDNSTGAVSFADLPGYPIHESCCIIQWNQQWQEFSAFDKDGSEDYDMEDVKPWTGSLVKLSFNIDTNENSETDVQLVNYIGHESPTSYYGTQIGQTQSWKADIDCEDVDTIYALRRLASWLGDVYVRDPSGIGYWATVKVSMSNKYRQTITPVTIEITRVEGGA